MNKPHKHADLIKAWADGAEIQYRINDLSEWCDYLNHRNPEWHDHHEYRIKPPAPKWPETTMTNRQLEIAYAGHRHAIAVHPEPDEWRRIANAAIAHALETGQVVLPSNGFVTTTKGASGGSSGFGGSRSDGTAFAYGVVHGYPR